MKITTKTFILSAFVSLTAVSVASAEIKKTVETIVTCQQREGDQWVEVGIALNDGPGLSALVVKKDEMNNSAQLVVSRSVSSKTQGRKTIYQDEYETIHLVVVDKNDRLEGRLMVLQDGPGGINKTGLLCYKNHMITYDDN